MVHPSHVIFNLLDNSTIFLVILIKIEIIIFIFNRLPKKEEVIWHFRQINPRQKEAGLAPTVTCVLFEVLSAKLWHAGTLPTLLA